MLSIYLYTVTSVSLLILYIAGYVLFDALLRFLFGVDTSISTRQAIAGGLGYAVIAFPLWHMHWQWLTRHIADHPSAVEFHRRYLFIVTGISIFAMLLGGGISVMSLAQLALGASDNVGATCVNVGRAFFIFLLSTALWLHHWQEFDEEERTEMRGKLAAKGIGN